MNTITVIYIYIYIYIYVATWQVLLLLLLVLVLALVLGVLMLLLLLPPLFSYSLSRSGLFKKAGVISLLLFLGSLSMSFIFAIGAARDR